eukprot:s719_g10.t1
MAHSHLSPPRSHVAGRASGMARQLIAGASQLPSEVSGMESGEFQTRPWIFTQLYGLQLQGGRPLGDQILRGPP